MGQITGWVHAIAFFVLAGFASGTGLPEGNDLTLLLPELNRQALANREAGDYKASRAAAQRAVAITEQQHAENSADGAASFNNLGAILEIQGEIPEARKWLLRALTVREKMFGADDPLVAETVSDLALAERQEGHFKPAVELYSRALRIYQEAGKPADRLAVLNNLGRVLEEQGQLREAERMFHQAIAEAGAQAGAGHPSPAPALMNLANVLRLRRKYGESEKTLRQAMDIDRRTLPAGHPRIGSDLSVAAALAFDRKRYAEAEELYRQAIMILAQYLPSSHAEIGKLTASMAEVYFRERRIEESLTAYAKSLAILEAAWGRENPQLLPTLDGYARALKASEDFADAARLEVRATKIRVTRALHS